MADGIAFLDTSILIEHFRKTDKSKTAFAKLNSQFAEFRISVITEHEILCGLTSQQANFWESLSLDMKIVELNSSMIHEAIKINLQLKSIRKQIAFANLLIAATALALNIPLVTLNIRHFERVPQLKIILLDS